MSLGNIFTQTLTLTATGAEAIDLTLNPFTTLLDRAYGVYATYTDPHFAHFDRTNPGVLTDLGLFANGSPGGNTLYTVDLTTGQATALGPVVSPLSRDIGAMAFDDAGQLYAHDLWNQELVQINLARCRLRR